MDYCLVALFSAFLVNLFFLFLTFANIFFLKKTSSFKKPKVYPKVSVLVPARNEEENIEACISSLLSQDYPDYEVIVLNDNSKDRTEEILKKFISYKNFKYYNGKELIEGWKGKTFASQQLFEYAGGEILFFTDADTVHDRNTLSFLVGKMEEFDVDFISGFAYHITKTFGEKIIVPALYIMSTLFLPLAFIYYSKLPFFSFAIGQLIFVKRKVLEEIGGFECVKDEVVEDIVLARVVKENGFRSLFLDAKNYISCRMYENYIQGFLGIARVIYPAISKNIFIFLALVFAILLTIEFPLLYMILNFGQLSIHTNLASLSFFLFFSAWAISLYDRKQPLSSIILYPVFFLNLILIAFYSMLKIGFGRGIAWKERLVK